MIDQMAKLIVQENKEYIGTEVADDVITNLDNNLEAEKEVTLDVKEEKRRVKTTRTRKSTK